MFKVCIAGSRGFSSYEFLKAKMDSLLRNKHPDVSVICGEAAGADRLGERYAQERGYAVESFPADWDTYGKRAGYLRNIEMAEAASACVVFWDGVSRGAAHMIDICRQKNVPLRVVRYDSPS